MLQNSTSLYLADDNNTAEELVTVNVLPDPRVVSLSSTKRCPRLRVKKWSDAQMGIFASILAETSWRDGCYWSWIVELETLANKKASNEKLFAEIQERLESEFRKDENLEECASRSIFSLSQLRTKYKWLKREWKSLKGKMKYGMLEGERLPSWYRILDPIFLIALDKPSNKDTDKSPKNAPEDHEDESVPDADEKADENSPEVDEDDESRREKDIRTIFGADDINATTSENGNICSGNEAETNCNSPGPNVINPPEQSETNEMNVDSTEMVSAVENERYAQRKRPLSEPTVVQSSTSNTFKRVNPTARVRAYELLRKYKLVNKPVNKVPVNKPSAESDNKYIDIIKHLTEAEKRREEMFIAFQKEQAEANRKHEMMMTQMFLQLSTQQQMLSSSIQQLMRQSQNYPPRNSQSETSRGDKGSSCKCNT